MGCVSTILVIKPNDAQLASNQAKHYPWDLVGLIGPSWVANNLFLLVTIAVLPSALYKRKRLQSDDNNSEEMYLYHQNFSMQEKCDMHVASGTLDQY